MVFKIIMKMLIAYWVIAKKQLIHNQITQRNSWNQTYDFIVIGGGTAGCVVAHRLTEDPNVNVLLLEAGDHQDAIWTDLNWFSSVISDNRPNVNWKYYSEPSQNAGGMFPGNRVSEFMGKVIGGSSTHNEAVFNRGNRRVYDNWARLYGAQGWNYINVLPYFLKYENTTDPNIVAQAPNYHGTSGLVQISPSEYKPKLLRSIQNTLNNLGYLTTDFNGPDQKGVAFPQMFIDNFGLRVSSGTAYVDPNPHPKNLHIVTRALVVQIIFEGNTAVGVKFNRNDTPYIAFAKKELILSAGAYNTPQILMLSGIGERDHLEKIGIPVLMELPVGNNLMNHPVAPIMMNILDKNFYETENLQAQLTIDQIEQRYFKHTGPLGRMPRLYHMHNSSNKYDPEYPNIVNGYIYLPDGRSMVAFSNLVISRSRGNVRLNSPSPYIAPRIDSSYYDDPRDLDNIVDGLIMMLHILETPGFNISQLISIPSFDNLGCPICSSKYLYKCPDLLKCYAKYVTQGGHPGGTCRMGDISRNDVVVDPQLRVKNISKLRVCDASIFPQNPNSNTAAAVFMVAEKCAQMIKNTYNFK